MGVVEHSGPYRTRAEAQLAVDRFDVEVARRTDAEWWQMDAVNHDRPMAQIIGVSDVEPSALLQRRLADWELPI